MTDSQKSPARSVFWDDLQERLQDPGYLRDYVTQSLRISTIDRLVNRLAAALEAQDVTKAEVARRLNTEAATIRRLFTQTGHNPTLGTLTEVAGALGFRVELVAMSDDEREQVTTPLRDGVMPAGVGRSTSELR